MAAFLCGAVSAPFMLGFVHRAYRGYGNSVCNEQTYGIYDIRGVRFIIFLGQIAVVFVRAVGFAVGGEQVVWRVDENDHFFHRRRRLVQALLHKLHRVDVAFNAVFGKIGEIFEQRFTLVVLGRVEQGIRLALLHIVNAVLFVKLRRTAAQIVAVNGQSQSAFRIKRACKLLLRRGIGRDGLRPPRGGRAPARHRLVLDGSIHRKAI